MLAKKIGWSFVELNKEIEAQNGLSVAEIIRAVRPGRFSPAGAGRTRQLLAGKS